MRFRAQQEWIDLFNECGFDVVRKKCGDPDAGPNEKIARGDDVRAVVRTNSDLGERIGQDGVAGRGGEARHRCRQLQVILRTRDDEAALDSIQATRESRQVLS